MTWWAWAIVFAVLVIGAGVVLFRVGLRVWRSAAGVFTEIGEASQQLGSLSEQFQQLSEAVAAQQKPDQQLAVFLDPAALRRSRDREVRRRYARGRAHARRALSTRSGR